MHQRQVIRDAVVVALTGATDAAARVYSTQKQVYSQRELPAIAVYTLDEKSSLDGTAPRELDRRSSLVVEAIVSAGANVDNAMDDIAEQIEAAMDADPYFTSSCSQSYLSDTGLVSEPDGDREIGILTMTYLVRYTTDAFVAPVAPVDFETAQTVYDVGAGQILTWDGTVDATLALNVALSPDEDLTADSLTATDADGRATFATPSVVGEHVYTIYVKRNSATDVAGKIRLYDGVGNTDLAFTATATWQRLDITKDVLLASVVDLSVWVDTDTESILIWRPQFEATVDRNVDTIVVQS